MTAALPQEYVLRHDFQSHDVDSFIPEGLGCDGTRGYTDRLSSEVHFQFELDRLDLDCTFLIYRKLNGWALTSNCHSFFFFFFFFVFGKSRGEVILTFEL
jgi:hypothetical protein